MSARAVERLLDDGELLGLRRYLEADRAEALARRAQSMRDMGRMA